MKKTDLVVREYVSKLSFDTLKFLAERFRERMGSDLAEAVDILLKSPDLDRMLGAAKDGDEFFATLDLISGFVEKEYLRRVPDLVDV